MRRKTSIGRSVVVALLFAMISFYSYRVSKPVVAERPHPASNDSSADDSDNSNAEIFSNPLEAHNVYFYATVVAIRPASSYDKLIGTARLPHSRVAVLRVSRIERGSDSRIAEGRVIVLRIYDDEDEEFWQYRLSQNSDTRFAKVKIGKYETIFLAGC